MTNEMKIREGLRCDELACGSWLRVPPSAALSSPEPQFPNECDGDGTAQARGLCQLSSTVLSQGEEPRGEGRGAWCWPRPVAMSGQLASLAPPPTLSPAGAASAQAGEWGQMAS